MTKLDEKDLHDVAEELGAKARSLYDEANHELHTLPQNIEQRISEKPLQSTLVALGVGLFFGLLLGR